MICEMCKENGQKLYTVTYQDPNGFINRLVCDKCKKKREKELEQIRENFRRITNASFE